jgi:hypothetical protein
MSTTDLVFRLLGINEASKAFREVRDSAAETGAATEEAGKASGLFGMSAKTGFLAAAAAAVAVGVKTVEMAARFETGMTQIVTGAGEAQKNMKMIESGVLSLAVSTGTSTQDLTNGLYHIESAGFHGAQALDILKVAAQGAKVGNADLDTVGKTLTGTMNSYAASIKSPTALMNMLVATTASGDMRMQDLASSLGSVTPIAAAANISFQQVAGAIATMTSQNMSAQQATQDLANLIRVLGNPTAVATKEMAAMGLNSTQVSKDLGREGLTGTLAELTSAITSHMGPSGLVLQNAFNQSKTAAGDAATMLKLLPPSIQGVAKEMLAGTITSKQWTTATKGMTVEQSTQAKQFALTVKHAQSFNDILRAGGPAAQTYNAALAEMTGGATGLNTSLMLTGANASVFAGNVKTIGEAGKKTTGDVTGWNLVTQTLSFKLDQAKQVVETLGIKIGVALLPVAKDLVSGFIAVASHAGVVMTVFGDMEHVVASVVGWLDKNRTVAEALGIGLAAVGTVMLAQAIPGIVASTIAWGDEALAAGAAAIATMAAAAPFIAIGVVVAALAFGFIELIKHWNDVEHVFDVGFNFVKEHWKEFVAVLLPGVGIFIVAVTTLVQHWGDVEKFFGTATKAVTGFFEHDLIDPVTGFFEHTLPKAWDTGVRLFNDVFVKPQQIAIKAVIGFFENDLVAPVGRLFGTDIPRWFQAGVNLFNSIFVNPVKSAVKDVEAGFDGTFGRIPQFVQTAFSVLVGIVKAPINGVIDIVNAAINGLDSIHVSVPSWVPFVGGQSFGISIPTIPTLATGGLVMPQPGGTMVNVAEAGQAEIVSPLPALQQAMTAALGATGGYNSGGAQPGSAGNPLYAEIDFKLDGQHIDRQLVIFQRRGGKLQSVAMAVSG